MNFELHLTYNLRGAWHTQYAMLFSYFKLDDTTYFLPWRLWKKNDVFDTLAE